MTRKTATRWRALALVLLAPACQNAASDNQHFDNNNPYECLGTSVKANERNNYSSWSKMTLPVIKVKPETELSFDWGSVTKDFIAHDVDAKNDLNMLMVLFFQLPLPDLEVKLNADSLTQNDLVIAPPLTLRTNGTDTTAKLFSFDLNGAYVEPERILLYFDADFYPPAEYTYALAAATGIEVGLGIRILQTFQLDPSSSNTDVKLTDSSVKLEWTANLHDLAPTGIPKGEPAITLDWGDMTQNGLGADFDPTQITRALVAHYTQGSGELEKEFLDIELIATELYEAEIEAGSAVDFSTMTRKSDGASFPGIDDTGTWLVALQCGVCRNPSPWYLSILKPCQ
ncbi:MAG: hypothetical protein JXP73_18115 [Deltaproteobacteria bacterium]|nr:hypothetical protein [Deltaproteobacteria bacterium]